MPILAPSTAIRALKMTQSHPTRTVPASTTTIASLPVILAVTQSIPRRTFSITPQRAAASGAEVSGEQEHEEHHEERFDPPSGWLWGIKPGEKYEKEGWENIWMYGMFGSLGVAAIAYAFKPDTSIQTWALEEARRRLEAEGILKEPDDDKTVD